MGYFQSGRRPDVDQLRGAGDQRFGPRQGSGATHGLQKKLR